MGANTGAPRSSCHSCLPAHQAAEVKQMRHPVMSLRPGSPEATSQIVHAMTKKTLAIGLNLHGKAMLYYMPC